MRLFKLYLGEQDLGIQGPTTKDTNDTNTVDIADKQIDAITSDLKRSLEGVVKSLGRLPVMSTRTEARDNLEKLMGGLTEFIETFNKGGTNYESMQSAILAGGKQSGVK